jgi:hypothetical protein
VRKFGWNEKANDRGPLGNSGFAMQSAAAGVRSQTAANTKFLVCDDAPALHGATDLSDMNSTSDINLFILG